jgi:hypothetical protein
MELVRLSCNGCGADLDVSDDTRFITCGYCSAKLEVKRTESAAYTRVRKAVERVERRTEEIAGEVKELREENRMLSLERDIDQLDREWEERKKELMLRAKDGTLRVPTRGQALAIGLVAAVAAILMGGMGTKLRDGMGAIIGLFVGGVGLIVAVLQHNKALAYERAHTEYLDRRDALTDQLDKKRRRARKSRDED